MTSSEKRMLALISGGVVVLLALGILFLEEGLWFKDQEASGVQGEEEKTAPSPGAETAEKDQPSKQNARPAKEYIAPAAESVLAEDRAAAEKALAGGGVIEGRIVDESGTPVEGAAVRLEKDPEALFFNLETGSSLSSDAPKGKSGKDGAFRLKDAPAMKAACLRVRHSDFVPQTVKLARYDGARRDVGEIALVPGASISGFVRNLRGEAVSGAVLCAHPAQSRQDDIATFFVPGEDIPPWQSVSGEDGFYRITGLPEVKITLEAAHKEYVNALMKDLEVEKGKERVRTDLVLHPGASVSGRVIDEENRPVAGAHVRKQNIVHMDLDTFSGILPGTITTSAVTDDDGCFTLKGLEEGEITLRVSAAGFLTGTVTEVHTGSGDLVVVLGKGAWLAGWVRDARSAEPVSAFEIEVKRPDSPAWQGADRLEKYYGAEALDRYPKLNDEEGAFFIQGLREGPFSLICKAEGFGDTVLDHLAAYLGGGETIEIALWPEAAIAGTLVTVDGEPVEGGNLSLKNSSRPPESQGGMLRRSVKVERNEDTLSFSNGDETLRSVRSGPDGGFEFRGIPEGDFLVTADHPDHTDAVPLPVRTERGGRIEGLVIRLGASGSIAGTVFDPFQRPLPGALVEARQAGKADLFGNRSRTDEKGKYQFTGLEPAEYWVKLAPEPGEGTVMFMSIDVSNALGLPPAGSHAVQVTAGQESLLDLFQAMKGSIDGEVTEAGAPVREVMVKLFRGGAMQFMPLKTTGTDSSGRYAFNDLEPGDYRILLDLGGVPEPIEANTKVPEGAAARQDFALPSGRISGLISDRHTGDPLSGIRVKLERFHEEGEEESPKSQVRSIGFVAISAENHGDGEEVSTFTITGGSPEVFTDEHGRYEIRYIKEGAYKLVAEGGGYAPGSLAPVKVYEAVLTDHQDLKLLRGYKVSGILIDNATGGKLPHVAVFCQALDKEKEGDGREFSLSDAGGAFHFAGLNPGTYRIEADWEGVKAAAEVVVADGDVENVELRAVQ